MAGFATVAEIRAARNAERLYEAAFDWVGPTGAGVPAWQSPWYLQVIPGPGADPAAGSGTPGAGGTAYDQTAGGILFGNTPGRKYVASIVARPQGDGSPAILRLIDRLVGVGSVPYSTTGVKNIGSVALPRYASGEGVEVYFEVATAGATTIPVMNLASYTNQDGATGRVGTALTFHSATAARGSLQGPFALQGGDTGVRSVESIEVTTAGGGAGVGNILLVRQVCAMPFGSLNSVTGEVTERPSPFPYAHLRRVFDGATLQTWRRGPSASTRVEGFVSVLASAS